jgi:hypothetical protein
MEFLFIIKEVLNCTVAIYRLHENPKMPMPVGMVAVRILAAIVAAVAPMALNLGKFEVPHVKNVYEIRFEEAEKKAVEEAEKQILLAELQALNGQWEIMMEDAENKTDTQISSDFFKQISHLRVKAFELADKLGVDLTEFHTIRGAHREPEQVARLQILMA